MLSWFPLFPLLAAVILSAIEFSIGVCLFFRIRKRRLLCWLPTDDIHDSRLPLSGIEEPGFRLWLFGDAWVLTNWETFRKNIVLFIAAILLFGGKRRLYVSSRLRRNGGFVIYHIVCVCTFVYCPAQLIFLFLVSSL